MLPYVLLTDRQREEVIKLWVAGRPVTRLAEEFNVADNTIRKILNKAKAVRTGEKPISDDPSKTVSCENKEQTYRDNLRWAIEAAGEFSRSGKRPASCPNNSAWYLYIQATKDPKDFLGRIGQVESKGDVESEEKKNLRISSQRSIEEIENFLKELNQEEGK